MRKIKGKKYKDEFFTGRDFLRAALEDCTFEDCDLTLV